MEYIQVLLGVLLLVLGCSGPGRLFVEIELPNNRGTATNRNVKIAILSRPKLKNRGFVAAN